jgi:hypothetical protein
MRKIIMTLLAAVAVAFTLSSPASAGGKHHPHKATIIAGAVVGTVVGIGLHEGWWTSTAASRTVFATSTGAATGGFIAGVATVALIHAATTPCQGFQAMMMMSKGCKDGKYVGPKRQAFLFW